MMATSKRSTSASAKKTGKSGSRKGARSGKSSGPVPVLVEVVVPRADGTRAAFDAGGAAFDAVGFSADGDFAPIPLDATPETALRSEEAREQTVLVRGSVEEGEIAALEAQDNIAAVWLDTEIAPFGYDSGYDSSYGGERRRDNVEVAESAGFAPCPIPPCDCPPPMTAKGDIPAVRKYLGVDKIWADGFKGKGIVVGVVDGGLTTPARVAGGKIPNVIGGPKANWGKQAFWGGHGEMSATDVLGMASEAKLYDLRLPDGGAGDTLGAQISDAIAGYHWAIQRHAQDGTPQILTNSWGIYQKSWDPTYATNPNHPFTRKVVEAVQKGILVLFAAGNCGQACPSGRCGSDAGPGKSIWGANGHPLVMTVGAANTKEQLIGYSSQGPSSLDAHKPDFCSISHFKGYYAVDNGTSAACPVAAGVVALLKQAKPALTQAAAKACLKATAKNLGPAGWDQHSGSGIIQAYDAYRHCAGAKPCERERRNAIRCRNLYKRTKNRRYLCCFYYWAALYYRCRYRLTRNRRFLCLFYLYAARFFRCRYSVTKNPRDLANYRRYLALYQGCSGRVSTSGGAGQAMGGSEEQALAAAEAEELGGGDLEDEDLAIESLGDEPFDDGGDDLELGSPADDDDIFALGESGLGDADDGEDLFDDTGDDELLAGDDLGTDDPGADDFDAGELDDSAAFGGGEPFPFSSELEIEHEEIELDGGELGMGGFGGALGAGLDEAEGDDFAFSASEAAAAPDPCLVYRTRALRYRALYQRTGRRIYLCYSYRFWAAYFRCLYRRTRRRAYLCRFYYYWAQYQCCLYRVTRRRQHLCQCYLYRSRYYCCLYRLNRNQRYLLLCRRYLTAYRRCQG